MSPAKKKGNGAAKTAAKTKTSSAKQNASEILYAAVGLAYLQQEDVQKAFKYLVKKGTPRGKELEKTANEMTQKAREKAEELREQFSANAEELSKRFSELLDELTSKFGKEESSEANA